MLKVIILAILSVPSILATLSRGNMTSALIAAEDTGTLEDTFKTYEKEQYHLVLSLALVEVAKVQVHIPKVVTCLRVAHDPFPKDEMCVSDLVHITLTQISKITNTESFTNLITSFKSSDIKLLVAIRHMILVRDDALDVLKRAMDKSPELITDDLPNWLASHSLDRNSTYYSSLTEETFKYLASFAAQSVLKKVLAIVKKNEHYTVAYTNGHTKALCCKSLDSIPRDLSGKLNVLLELVKARNTRIKDTLTHLPIVLVDLVLGYVHVTPSDCSYSSSYMSYLINTQILLHSRTN